MQQPINNRSVQLVVQAQPGIREKQSIYKNMKIQQARQLIGLGMLQILIGILCIICQGVSLKMHANNFTLFFVGHGFWAGLQFLITGPFGVAGGVTKKRCRVAAFNALSIASAVFTLFLTGIAAFDAFLNGIGQGNCDDYYYSSSRSRYDCYIKGKTGTSLEATMAILGMMEFIFAIWSSVLCCTIGACCCRCGGSCCCPASPGQNQLLMRGQPFPGQQQVIFVTQQESVSKERPHMFSSNQSPTFLPNATIINLDPGQRVVQYNPQNPYSPSTIQQSTANRTFPLDQIDPSSYPGLHAGKRDTIMAPERPPIRGERTSTYDESLFYDRIENDEN